MSEKFKDRKEQRRVTETMNAMLLPLLPYLNSETAIIVKRALYLLGEIEIEPHESENEEYMNEIQATELLAEARKCAESEKN